jgi:hypothetical protein
MTRLEPTLEDSAYSYAVNADLFLSGGFDYPGIPGVLILLAPISAPC